MPWKSVGVTKAYKVSRANPAFWKYVETDENSKKKKKKKVRKRRKKQTVEQDTIADVWGWIK